MAEKSLKVIETDKSFFSKVTNTITKILIPTRVGFNGILIKVKRNNVLKSYEHYTNTIDSKKENVFKKYEDTYNLYLESIDKYVMDSIYKKVKNGVASILEKTALEKYYGVVHLKRTEYLEYKYVKQKYLLQLDYEMITTSEKNSLVEKYKKFYANKMEVLYKGLLKHYSIQLADSSNKNEEKKNEIFNKVFLTLEEYIVEILPLKMDNKKENDMYKDILQEYEELERYTVGKLDRKDCVEKNLILLAISRNLFTHSLPLVVAEQCYVKLLKEVRELIVISKSITKKEKLYQLLINLIQQYNVKLLSTKIYWDKPQEREQYKKFWEQYNEIEEQKESNFEEYVKQKEILFIRNDLKFLENRSKYIKIVRFYKDKLVDLGAMRILKNSCKTERNFKKVKCKVK